ncbi:MAG: hypothetical protein KH354_04895, partial [Clostridiales bacterium]|nr:hypothetical protein [Clostridiales bacterium]
MKHPYSNEQEYMDLSLTETIEPLPELSQPETTQVQEKSPAEAQAQAARPACENAGAAKPEQDIQPRVRRAKAPAAAAVRLPQRYCASTPNAPSPPKETAPEKNSAAAAQASAEAFRCNP